MMDAFTLDLVLFCTKYIVHTPFVFYILPGLGAANLAFALPLPCLSVVMTWHDLVMDLCMVAHLCHDPQPLAINQNLDGGLKPKAELAKFLFKCPLMVYGLTKY